ncbi:hypothetical protein TIFTF001_015853 [Ficus carica]|uniref:Amine oxidase n=1 Tax=Ficus carica TaxID=3494 RepID=A0AA88DIQ7_FICCA|nr:hypothetical protein TIFTF001_015853 [Ficus carica]
MLTSEEQEVANDMSSKYPPFVAAMRRRGLKVEEVVCGSFMVGWFGEEERKVKRMVRVMAIYLDGTVNFYMRPVEGVTVTVDHDEMKIVGFVDRLTVPISKADGTDYQESSSDVQEPGLNGITVVQPEGPSFRIERHSVSWNNFLDAGENGFGNSETVQKMQFSWMCMLLHEMGGRSKCPTLSASLSDNAGDIMWRHTENQIPNKLITEVRPEESLVVRLAATVLNYDYIVDWEFKQSWLNRVTRSKSNRVHSEGPHSKGSFWDAFGRKHNSPNWETTRVTDRSSPRKSYWKVVSETANTEPEAMIKFGSGAAELLVVNPNKRTKMGNNVGYRLIPE